LMLRCMTPIECKWLMPTIYPSCHKQTTAVIREGLPIRWRRREHPAKSSHLSFRRGSARCHCESDPANVLSNEKSCKQQPTCHYKVNSTLLPERRTNVGEKRGTQVSQRLEDVLLCPRKVIVSAPYLIDVACPFFLADHRTRSRFRLATNLQNVKVCKAGGVLLEKLW